MLEIKEVRKVQNNYEMLKPNKIRKVQANQEVLKMKTIRKVQKNYTGNEQEQESSGELYVVTQRDIRSIGYMQITNEKFGLDPEIQTNSDEWLMAPFRFKYLRYLRQLSDRD